MSGAPTSQFVQFPMGGGLAQDVDPRLLQQPQVSEALNLRIPKQGVYTKRPGTVLFRSSVATPKWASFTIAPSLVMAQGSLDDRLLLVDSHNVWCDMPTRNARVWRGVTPPAMPTKRVIWSEVGKVSSAVAAGSYPSAAPISSFAQTDLAAGITAAGKNCIASVWMKDGDTFFMICDAETLTPIQIVGAAYNTETVFKLATYVFPRVMWLGNDVYVTAAVGTGAGVGTVKLYKLNTSTWAFALVGSIVTDARVDITGAGPRAWYDACALTSTTIAFAYQDTPGLNLKVLRVTASTAATATSVTSAEAAAAVNEIGMCATTNESVWVVYNRNATSVNRVTCINEAAWTERAGFPMTGPPAWAAYRMTGAVCRIDSTTALCAWCGVQPAGGTAGGVMTQVMTITTAAATGGWEATAPNAMLTGKPFLIGSGATARWLIPAHTGGNTVADQWKKPFWDTATAPLWSARLLEVMHSPPADGNTFASQFTWGMAPAVTSIPYTATGVIGQFVTGSDNLYAPCSVAVLDGKYYHLASEITGVSNGGVREALCLISYDPTQTAHLVPRQLGSVAFFGGLAVDQACAIEHGWLERPEEIHAGEGATVASMANGTYNYRAVWAYATKSGQIMRSAPSNISSATTALGPTASVDVRVPLPSSSQLYWPHIWDGMRPWIEIYRTVDASSGPYYLVGQKALVQPDSTTSWVTITDGYADTSITKFPQLYTGISGTSQAQVANAGAPTFVTSCIHKARLFGVWPDRRTISFTSALIPFELPHCHVEFTLTIDDQIVALVSMDETLIAFSDRAIYALDGDGPSDRYPGADSDYRGFRRVCSDVGCSDALSPCLTADGIVFRSRNGLNVLGRGGQVVPWAKEVQDELDAFQNRTVITVHPNQRWLYVTCDDGDTGITLVYDYLTKVWTKDVRTLQEPGARMLGQHAHDGSIYWVDSESGSQWVEDATTSLDGGAWSQMAATFAPFQPGGALGFHGAGRFQVLSFRDTAHGLSFRVDYDHSTTAPETKTLTDAQVTAFPTAPVIQYRWSPTKKESGSLRFRLADAAPSNPADYGTGKGATWVSWGVDFEPKKQPRPLPAAQQG